MKIITMYIKNENDKAEIIYKSGEHIHECIYVPSYHIANLMINTYDDWDVELDEEEVEYIFDKIGEFEAYSIIWKSDIFLYEYIGNLNNKLDFIIDNDRGDISSTCQTDQHR